MNEKLIIGIDCFNISAGGGFTHLNFVLKELKKLIGSEIKIVLWGSENLIIRLPNYDWLKKRSNFCLQSNVFLRIFWHLFLLNKEIHKFNVDVLLCPGGICFPRKIPTIVMFRNILPFLDKEIKRYSFFKYLRFKLFRFLSFYSFKKSDGIIFLSNWSMNFIQSKCDLNNLIKIIPHGVKKQNCKKNKKDKKSDLKLIYVSHTSPYKNHSYVLENLKKVALEEKKLNFNFHSIGEICDGFNKSKWEKNLPLNLKVKFLGNMNHNKTLMHIKNSDICIFASSAENFPNVLLEYMSVGSVCICNEIEPMKSILGNSGVFFDMRKQNDLKNKLKLVLKNPHLQERLKMLSFKESQKYTWEKTAKLTLKFCIEVASKSFKNA